MTNSELVEEILHHAHSLGITDEVINFAKELREINPKLDLHSSIELAYSKLKP